MAAMLEVNGLSKYFGQFQAVNNISFTVNKGDVYGFLGQNGAGKSTTLRMLLNLIKPTEGKILLNGTLIKEGSNFLLQQTGAIIERPDLYKYLTAYQNLYIFAKMSGIKTSKSVLMQQLQMVGLADRYNSKVKDFSQGMKQRLGIAIALVHQPQLIILDEPTNGLDPQGIADMRSLILQLSNEMGKTVIVSSHLLSEIEVIANRMIIIHKGKKIVEGKVSELLDPANTLVECNTTNNEVSKQFLLHTKWGNSVQLLQDKIRLTMNKDEVPALVSMLTNEGIQILSVQPWHSLEDYFLSLTNHQQHVEPFTN